MPTRPAGTITFLFTDIEGSTQLWERFPDLMGRALERHDTLLREIAARHHGHVFKTVGDAFCVAFQDATAAVSAALEGQRCLVAEPWENVDPIKVRMGLHTGTAELRNDDYFGPSLNRVARIMGSGHGGQTLISRNTADLVRTSLPGGASLKDLGVARLRDLKEPEQIFQLLADDLPGDFPPLRSLESAPNNLPNQLTSFIGRDRELVEVKKLIASARLVTLTGPGGTGKTRLLIEAASSSLERFPDGVWLIELATLSDPDLLLPSIVSSIGIREKPDQPPERTLSDFLHDRAALLLIDNCEHLLQPCAQLIQTLLQQCPRLHIMTSSRAPLAVPGEQVFAVPTLSLPEFRRVRADELPRDEDYREYEAVRLFAERAVAARPSFALTPANAETIARICWRLDGIPHAIELAAARVRMLPPEQILRRLDDRFHLLTAANQGVLPHHQTLRTMIDWSYDMLSESEKALLLRLSVFGGGRSLDAVEEVCAGDPVDPSEVLDLLGQLVDKSLISMEETAAGEPRYFMLESLWDYARTKLDERAEMENYRDRHLEYFTRLAESAKQELEGPDQALWLNRLADDHGNLRLAIEWAGKNDGERGIRLVSALTRYWEVRSRLQEGRDQFAAMLELPAAQGRTLLRANALAGAGRLAWCADYDEIARRYYDEAIEIHRELGNEEPVGLLLSFLGFVDRTEGKPREAADKFAEALEIGERLGNKRIIVVALSGQGTLASDAGDHERGRELKQRSLDLYREIGDRWVLGLLSWSLARLEVAHGSYDRATPLFAEFARIADELGNSWSAPYVLEGFAEIALGLGDATRAATLFGAAEALHRRLGLSRSGPEEQLYRADLARLAVALETAKREEAWEEGARLTADKALKFALEP